MLKWLIPAFLLIGALAAALFYWNGDEPLKVTRYQVTQSCRYYTAHLEVDYPVGGGTDVVQGLRQWLKDSLHCEGDIGSGENPIEACFGACHDPNMEELREEYGEYADELGMSYDSTYVVFLSETKSTVSYQVSIYGYNYGAAHGWYTDPIFVIVKGTSRPLTFEDIFAVSRNKIVDYIDDLSKTEPSNKQDCPAIGINEIDYVYPTREGLAFKWHTYAVNCGACGNVVFTIPYERFKGMFTPKFEKLVPEFYPE